MTMVSRSRFALVLTVGVTVLLFFGGATDPHTAVGSPVMQFAEGVYTGNGGVQAVTDLGFQPKVVVTKANASMNVYGHAMMRSDTMTAAKNVTNETSDQGISSLDADGFTVTHVASNTGRTNEISKTYHWYAIGDGAIKTGTYTGNGFDGHTVTGVGFQPVMAWVLRSSLGVNLVFRTAPMQAEDYDFGTSTGQTNRIKGLAADGFILGTSNEVNQSTVIYHYVAFAGATNLHFGSYESCPSYPPACEGDSKTVPLPFSPRLAHIKADAGQAAVWKGSSLSGDATLEYGNVAAASNRIQSLGLNQFQVGNDFTVNAQVVNIKYYYFAATASNTLSLGGPADNPGTAFDGEPVNMFNGNFWHEHTDLVIPGRGVPMEFTRTYNSLDSRVGPLGPGWTHTYDMRLLIDRTDPAKTIVTRVSAGGGRDAFHENPDGTYATSPGVFDTLVENANQTFVLTTKNQIRYEFRTDGKLDRVKDRNDNTTTLAYDGTGRLTTVTDASNLRSLAFTYDPTYATSIKRVTEAPFGRYVEFTYDAATADLKEVKDVEAGVTTYEYSNHRMISLTDANVHQAMSSTYDPVGRVVEQRDALNALTCIYYGSPPSYTSSSCPGASPAPAASQTVIVDARGNATTYTHDSSGRATDIRDAQGGIVRREFDSSDNLICLTDKRGYKTKYVYDSAGNLTETFDALNVVPNASTYSCQTVGSPKKWTFTYTSKNDISSETDPLGRYTDYIYDNDVNSLNKGNLTRIAKRDSQAGAIRAITCFEPNLQGLVTGIVESTNLVLPGDPAAPTCVGNRSLFAYDTYGNQTCAVNARFSATALCSGGAVEKSTFIYDLGGRLLYSTDENVNKLRPVVGTKPETGPTQCESLGTGNFVNDDSPDDGVADDGCGSVAYTYDAQNNVKTVKHALGNLTSSDYDAKGALTAVKDGNRNTVVGQAETGSPCGTYGTGDGFDNDVGGVDGVIDDGCLSISYVYSAADRLEKVVEAAFNSGGATVYPITTYGYDLAGNRISVTNANRQPVGATETGSACGADADLDGRCDGADSDSDNDGVSDSAETNCGSDPLVANLFPERTDFGFLNSDENGDGAPDTLPASAPGHDCDGDAFTNAAESGTPLCGNGVNDDEVIHGGSDDGVTDDGCPGGPAQAGTYSEAQFNIGTNSQGRCGAPPATAPSPGWPTDFAWGGTPVSTNKITITDITAMIAPINRRDTSPGHPNFDKRFDILPGRGLFTQWININDFTAIYSGPKNTPTMMGENNAYNTPNVCPPAHASPLASPGSTQCGRTGTGDSTDSDGDGVKDDGCPSTTYSYDRLNRLQWSSDALGRVTTYQYDVASNLTQRKDGRGYLTKYVPDALNRVSRIEYWNLSGSQGSVDFAFDELGNRKTMVDSTGTTNYAYDSLDRLTCIGGVPIVSTCPLGNVSYRYDNFSGTAAPYPGQRTKVTYPDGKYMSYTYEPDGRMRTATDWLDRFTSYTYDAAGRLTNEYRLAVLSALETDYAYDAAGRLIEVWNTKGGTTDISKFTYAYDAVGNRKQMLELNLGVHTYQYDPLYRLTQATYPSPAQTATYSYDAVGNRKTQVAGSTTTTYTYDAADQLTAAAVGSTNTTYSYDANGNLIARGADAFSYDHENRMTSATVATVPSSSTYNGDGLRMTHTAGGSTSNYKWDVATSLPVVLQDGVNSYVYGLDLVASLDADNTRTFYLYDGLGSTTNLTDASGNNQVSYSYDAFGAIRAQTGSSPNQWLFTGEQRDSDSGLYYLRARYYDPAIGRFVSTDPIPTGNLYAYAWDNPTTFVDPAGRFGIPISTAVGAVVGGTAGGLSTLAVDFLEDGKINKSWREYAWNVGRGAAMGAICGSGTLTPVCVAALTAGTSAAADVASGDPLDVCQLTAESLSAGAMSWIGVKVTARVELSWKGPFGPRNEYIKRAGTYWGGSRARHAYAAGAIQWPFDFLGGLPGCGNDNAADNDNATDKE